MFGDTVNISGGNLKEDIPWKPDLTFIQRHSSRRRLVACLQFLDFTLFFGFALTWFGALAQPALQHRWLLHFAVSILAAAMMHCVFQCLRLYDFSLCTRGRKAASRALLAGIISLGPFLGLVLIQPSVSDKVAATACGLMLAGVATIALLRLCLAVVVRRFQHSGMVQERIYLIADCDASARSLQSRLKQDPGNRVVGAWTLNASTDLIESALADALAFLRRNPVDMVILRMPLTQPTRLLEAARVLRSLPKTVLLAPSLDNANGSFFSAWDGPPMNGRSEMPMVKLSERPLSGWRWLMKDIQDRTLALLILAVFSPLFLAIALGIGMSDPGPVFFRQKRYGYGGDTFDIIKFRTMRESGGPGTQSLTLTKRDDPRVFPFGRLLRKTSMDELPQLLNVLRGDMWLVGPRPHSPYAKAGGMIYNKAVHEYAARYRIKPGITGWAQVCGWRGPTDTLEQLNQRVQHGLYYIELVVAI